MGAKISKNSFKNKDITGGLPKIVDLLEARIPKVPAIMSEVKGIVKYVSKYKSKKKLIVKSSNEKDIRRYLINKNRYVLVKQGDYVSPGDILVNGSMSPHDVLYIKGVKFFIKYMIKEIQRVYKV